MKPDLTQYQFIMLWTINCYNPPAISFPAVRHRRFSAAVCIQDHALLRAGPAGPLKKDGMAPGIGLKVFRDNKETPEPRGVAGVWQG